MQIYLLRHGQTEYNAQHRYQGQQDIPLSAAGRAQLRPAGFMPDVAYVSPLIRARQTAEIFFPGCPQIIVQDLREMCFGSFEGRHYIHIEHDPTTLPGWKPTRLLPARMGSAFRIFVTAAVPPLPNWWKKALRSTNSSW